MSSLLSSSELLTAVARLSLALLLGSAIGVERQWRQKMAGLRTNALVSLGACGFIVLGGIFGQGGNVQIAAQVVTGVGFLGAGIILREGINVHGLNTAATLWCSAMVGAFAGGGYAAISVFAAALVILTNVVLRPLTRRLNWHLMVAQDVETQYLVEVTAKAAEEAHVRSVLLHAFSITPLSLRRIDSEDIADTSKVIVRTQAVSATRNDAALEQIVGRLSLEPYVSAATWQIDRTTPEA